MRVVVIGAGPAGATAARELARRGADVTLVEKSAWPRPKTCGDGVSPHAIREGHAMGLSFEGSVHLERALVTTPRDTAFTGRWPSETPWGTTIERERFDASLVDAAIAAGVRFLPGTTVTALAEGKVAISVTLAHPTGPRALHADAAIVAEGAAGKLAAKAGFPPFRSRLVALRGYANAPQPLEPIYGLFYDRMLSPGYGWVFPIDERRANVGICVDKRELARLGGNARAALKKWLEASPRARALLGDAPKLEDVRGGIIPTGRKTRARGRIFLAGDAAGVADPFTAEGIFQAIASGRFAAAALVEAKTIRAARSRYERALRIFDRNERAARLLRATFNVSIEPYARRAAVKPALADHLNTEVFLPKRGFLSFVWRLTLAW
jgi:geranylgeranyl reductase family protein